MKCFSRVTRGFTLIEVLIVIGIIAILATIVLVAINPARQFAQARDTKRVGDVNTILNAVGQYMAENRGAVPEAIPLGDPEEHDDYYEIGTGSGGADICRSLVPDYVATLPVDPDVNDGVALTAENCDEGGSYSTGYEIIQDEETLRITVRSTHAETDQNNDDQVDSLETISVTR